MSETTNRTVALVGAGPGDPELLTVAAEAALGQATVVITDSCVADLAAAFATQAEIEIFAGRHGDDALDRLLAGHHAGSIVRLYVGDPWLHAAFAAERRLLIEAGIDFDVVPGVSPELGMAAVAGIPTHHRPHSVTLTIGVAGDLPLPLDPARTLLTSTSDVRSAATALLDAGADAAVTAAAINAIDAEASAARGRLGSLIETLSPSSPGVLVVGAVAG